MNESLHIAAQFLDPVGGVLEDWSTTAVSKPLYRRSSYVWLGGSGGYPHSLAERDTVPDSILLSLTLDGVPDWEPIFDAALAKAQRRVALLTRSFEHHLVAKPTFTYRELVEHFIGLWRAEFVGQGGGHIILLDKRAKPTPRCFRKFSFFRRVHTTELVLPQPD